MSAGPLSVVIPALNAAGTLPAALACLAEGRAAGLVREVLVVDGGSADATPALAARAGARVLAAPCGRGRQLAAGAQAAVGDWLLFLHADTELGPGWAGAARAFIAAPGNEGRAAVFRFALDDPDPRARRVERLARWRARALALPYGDQGLLISQGLYRALGGFRPLPLMEDVDLVRRIGRRRLVVLDAAAVTSAARYRAGGWWLRPLRNLSVLALYLLGAPPGLLRRLYG
ncbi:MAG: TIGR04283 family arsenosugar biosynthesis glycosyltransferase [Kiloniellaceae bacterium]